MNGTDEVRRTAAKELFERAYELQMAGKLQEAIDLYSKSIEQHPTAEAYTFRGWTYSFLNEVQRAIEDCHRAIAVDPDFGNPYNDIGAYLIQLGKFDEAVPWLERATVARRYVARCFPWANLARVYEHKGQWIKALGHYRRSLEESPTYPVAMAGVVRLRGLLN
jgi:Tfp pilus assembly protein PilF